MPDLIKEEQIKPFQEFLKLFLNENNVKTDQGLFIEYVITQINKNLSINQLLNSLFRIIGIKLGIKLITDSFSFLNMEIPSEDIDKNTSETPYIVYVIGIDNNLNTITRLYKEFIKYGKIKGIQVIRNENIALIEFFELRSAYLAVTSDREVFQNKFIKVGFACDLDESIIKMFQEESFNEHKGKEKSRDYDSDEYD